MLTVPETGDRPLVHAPIELALLDTHGVIVAVNDAWLDFTVENGGDPDRCGPGTSYLDICDRAGDADSARVAAAIRIALDGDLPAPVTVDLPCDAPGRPRRFDTLISSRYADDGRCVGATVTLSERRPPAVPTVGQDLKRRILEIVDDAALPLAATDVEFAGRLDDLSDPGLADAVAEVVRVGLANVVRHSCARTARIAVRRRGPMLTVEIADDGVGCSGASPGVALRRLEWSALHFQGGLQLSALDCGGTVLTWTAVVPAHS